MKKELFIIILLLIIPFSYALNTELECPTTVQLNEEFECTLKISEGKGFYDVKFHISKGSSSLARIWDESTEDWRSAYYYLTATIENNEEETFKIKVTETGNYEAEIKLRQEARVETFPFNLEVTTLPKTEYEEEKTINEEATTTPEETLQGIKTRNEAEEKIEEETTNTETKSPITLNTIIETENKEPAFFESKNSKIMNSMIAILLITILLITIFHLWEKF